MFGAVVDSEGLPGPWWLIGHFLSTTMAAHGDREIAWMTSVAPPAIWPDGRVAVHRHEHGVRGDTPGARSSHKPISREVGRPSLSPTVLSQNTRTWKGKSVTESDLETFPPNDPGKRKSRGKFGNILH